MPFLTRDNLTQLAVTIESYHTANPERWKRPDYFVLFYGTEKSYLMESRYTQLFGKNIMVAGTGGRIDNQPWPSVLEQLTECLEKAEAARNNDRLYDAVVCAPERTNNIWKEAAGIDSDAADCEAKVKGTPAKWDADALASEQSFEEAHRALAYKGGLC